MSDLEQVVCVIGLGYIGLPTASLLATKGYQVHGVDVSDHIVETINRGDLHIYEPDLDILVKSAVGSGRLKASRDPVEADIFILAVPTPFTQGHEPDLNYVQQATEALAPQLRKDNLVILESTVPVGATEKVRDWIAAARPDLNLVPPTDTRVPDREDLYIAHCPERVLPGRVLQELVSNDRIVGGVTPASTDRAAAFYRGFVAGEILATNARTAELAKLSENAFRDVNIAFANELSIICDSLGINVWELIDLANHHPRVNILQPGPGVGGHCIAVDPWFIIGSAPSETPLMRTARSVNDGKPRWVINKVKEKAAKFKAPQIACLGLTFKANIDDLRESPALEITRQLAEEQVGEILAVDPYIKECPQCLAAFDNVRLVPMSEAATSADILLLLVDHDAFKALDRSLLQEKVVIDTRGAWRQ